MKVSRELAQARGTACGHPRELFRHTDSTGVADPGHHAGGRRDARRVLPALCIERHLAAEACARAISASVGPLLEGPLHERRGASSKAT